MNVKKALVYSLLVLTALSFGQCMNDCGSSDPGLYGSFLFRDKTTGRPYYEVSQDKPDNLQIYEQMPGDTIPYLMHGIVKDSIQNEGYSFGLVELYGLKKTTLYFQFNKTDMDTLILSAQLSKGNPPCYFDRALLTAVYNGRLIKTIDTDTSGVFIKFTIVK